MFITVDARALSHVPPGVVADAVETLGNIAELLLRLQHEGRSLDFLSEAELVVHVGEWVFDYTVDVARGRMYLDGARVFAPVSHAGRMV